MTPFLRGPLLCALLAWPIARGVGQEARTLSLPQAVALAQAQGHQARSAEATRDAAMFRHRQFGSRLLPQLSLTGTVPSYNRSIVEVQQPDGSLQFRPRDQTNANLGLQLSQQIPWTGGDLFVSSSLARYKVSGTSGFESWSSTPFTIGIRQDILRPNAVRWDQRADALQGELAERQYLEAREEVAITISGLFFDVYASRMQLANATKNAAVNDTLYRLNTGRYEVGKIGENDLLQSELALLRAQAAVDDSRLNFERAMASLRLALDMPVDTPVEIVVTGDVPEVTVDTAAAVSATLQHGSVVPQTRLQLLQADRSLTQARLSNGVGASVQASYGYNATGDGFGTAYDQLREARQFSVAVQVPLWQWGAHREGVEAARAERERAETDAETAVRQAEQDARFAVLELEQAQRNLLIAAKSDTVAGKRFEVAYNRYVIGRIDIDNLYVAQNEKDQALVSYVQALRGYWQAYYRLRRITLVDFATGEVIR
jgi:outer membrane protein TolC